MVREKSNLHVVDFDFYRLPRGTSIATEVVFSQYEIHPPKTNILKPKMEVDGSDDFSFLRVDFQVLCVCFFFPGE